MPTDSNPTSISALRLWGGRVMSFLPALLLLVDAVMKFVKPPQVVEGTIALGFPESSITGMGIALLVSVIFYLIPATSVIGAILLTGYLGGAVVTHVRAGHGAFEITFPVIFGMILWGGLVLREKRLEVILPWRRT
ncbi:MAG: DoxX family protein [Planctomycetia bacterium]|nr:DoxX family protein [Planctomycetia bacterium]